MKKKDIKEKSWLLYKESKKFLEENKESWKKRKLERDKENERIERVAIAKEKPVEGNKEKKYERKP